MALENLSASWATDALRVASHPLMDSGSRPLSSDCRLPCAMRGSRMRDHEIEYPSLTCGVARKGGPWMGPT